MKTKATSNYVIKLCTPSELEQLMSFIHEYWQEDHILSKSKKLVKWQYHNPLEDHYNFVLTKARDDNEIIGILGYIPTYRFDKNLAKNKDIWLSVWKAREDVKVSGFGLQMLHFLLNYEDPNTVGAVGINDEVAQIYKRLDYQVGTMQQHYMINSKIKDYNLVKTTKANQELIPNLKGNESGKELDKISIEQLKELASPLQDKTNRVVPQKSLQYIKKRYLEHPFYEYEVYSLEQKEYKGLVVIRENNYQNNKALRIVDYMGDASALVGMGPKFKELLRSRNAEYIDAYHQGQNQSVFEGAGFKRLDYDGNLIIPNYYEPFERKNVKILYAYKFLSNQQDNTTYSIYIGDSDQDRPNTLRG